MPKQKGKRRKISANPFLTDASLKKIIESLKIPKEQAIFLIDEAPNLNAGERIELLDVLKDVYVLNEEEKSALERIKNSFA